MQSSIISTTTVTGLRPTKCDTWSTKPISTKPTALLYSMQVTRETFWPSSTTQVSCRPLSQRSLVPWQSGESTDTSVPRCHLEMIASRGRIWNTSLLSRQWTIMLIWSSILRPLRDFKTEQSLWEEVHTVVCCQLGSEWSTLSGSRVHLQPVHQFFSSMAMWLQMLMIL